MTCMKCGAKVDGYEKYCKDCMRVHDLIQDEDYHRTAPLFEEVDQVVASAALYGNSIANEPEPTAPEPTVPDVDYGGGVSGGGGAGGDY